MKKLNNKVVVVTGGNGLLGRAFMEKIIEEGGNAFSADINNVNDIAGGKLYCDITNENSVEDMVRLLVEKFGKIDGWINNAYPRTKDWGLENFESESIESWRKNIDMHLNGYVICCKTALNQMKKQGYGSLINLSSIYGILGPDFSIYEGTQMKNPAAYAAIKGGIVNLSRYLASYYGPFGIRINCISPGGIFDNQQENFIINYEKKTPLKRMGTPNDISPAAIFLISDDSSYITGHNLIVDGGWSIV